MSAPELLNELRCRLRAERERAVSSRISTARAQCQVELEQSLRTLARALENDCVNFDRVFWMFVASRFLETRRLESLLSDPLCDWHTPFDVFTTQIEFVLLQMPNAHSAEVLNAFSPNICYPLGYCDGAYNIPLEWHFPDGSSQPVGEEDLRKAIGYARKAVEEWQAFWDHDACWQREHPREWLRIHFERLQRFVAVVAKVNELSHSRHAEQEVKLRATIAGAAKSVQDLSIALTNDAAELALPSEAEKVRQLECLAAVAAERCPPVLQSELATDEFWESASEMSRALTALLGSPMHEATTVPLMDRRLESQKAMMAEMRSGESPPSTEIEHWLTVTNAASAAGVAPYHITRAANRGDLLSNGMKGSARRIDAASLANWQLSRATQPERAETDGAVQRMLRRAGDD